MRPSGPTVAEAGQTACRLTTNVSVAWLLRAPLVPTMAGAYVPGGVLVDVWMLTVEVAKPLAVRLTLIGENVAVAPCGRLVMENVTVPAKPFTDVTLRS